MAEDNKSRTKRAFDWMESMMFGKPERMDAWREQMDAWQHAGFEQASHHLEEAAHLTRATMSFQRDLLSNMVDMNKEIFSQATSFFTREQK